MPTAGLGVKKSCRVMSLSKLPVRFEFSLVNKSNIA